MTIDKITVILILLLTPLVVCAPVGSQAATQPNSEPTTRPASKPIALEAIAKDQPNAAAATFQDAAGAVQTKLEQSLAEYRALQERVRRERLPLSRKLSDIESKLIKVRQEHRKATSLLDNRRLGLTNLRKKIKSRKEELSYLSETLLGEYIRSLEPQLHIAEVQRYRDVLEEAKLAPENKNLSKEDVLKKQAKMLDVSLGRLEDALGGSLFDGNAVDADGLVNRGKFALVGPIAIFRSEDGKSVGAVEQRLGSLEPSIVAFGSLTDAQAAAGVIENSNGQIPIDPTLGNAHKVESTKQTLWEHIQKGGPVMAPILGMAAAALLVAMYKLLVLTFVRKPSAKQLRGLMDAVARKDPQLAMQKAKAIKGPSGKMLTVGVEHLSEGRELIEESMYETVLATRLRLRSKLMFIAMSAASAPLLGLLGTVTGIINTFKLITVFGSGDVKMLSGGISEALITTEFGLIVAIPSLLLHAFLSRKANGICNQMEKAAIAFANEASRAQYKKKTHHQDMDDLLESDPEYIYA